MNGHWVAAEGRHRLPGGGITGGRESVSPAGRLHAVDPDTRLVLCGEPLRSLVAFPEMLWAAVSSGVLCRDCVAALHAGPSGAGRAPGERAEL